MKSKLITLAKNARHLKWIHEVQDCMNRPKGMPVNGVAYTASSIPILSP